MKIVWDEPKRLANIDKHRLDFADLNEAFFADALVLPAKVAASGALAQTRRVLFALYSRSLEAKASASSVCGPPTRVKGRPMPNISKKNKPYSAADMRAVSDNPEWTRKDFAKAKRFEEIFPDLARTIGRRGKQKAPTKKAVSMRLDTDVLEAYKATGAKWQSRINSDLRKVMKLG